MLMTEDQIEAAAAALVEARKAGTFISSLADVEPTTVADAEAISDRAAALLGWDVVGWKLGCTSVEAQEMLASPGPFAGRMFAQTAFVDGVLPAEALQRPLVECEFGFLTGADMAPEARTWTPSEVRPFIDAIVPTIEFVDSRFEDFESAGYLSHTADYGANGGFICGTPIPLADVGDLATTVVSASKNGTFERDGTGAAVLDDPWNALAWFFEHLGHRGIPLPAGSMISSGTCCGVIAIEIGDTVTASFAGLGDVSVTRR